MPQHLRNTTIIEEILLELEAVSAITIGDVLIHRQYPSVTEFAAQLKSEREREVIMGRLEGKTLNELGLHYGVSREQIRQNMQRGLRNRPRLREDQYRYIYEHYDFSLDDFMLSFDEPKSTYYYLEIISRTNRARVYLKTALRCAKC